jgi:hypothetical protein
MKLEPGSVFLGGGVRNVELGNFILTSVYTVQSSTWQVQGLGTERGHTRCIMRESHIRIVVDDPLRCKMQSKGHDVLIMPSCFVLLFVQRTHKVKTTSRIQAH